MTCLGAGEVARHMKVLQIALEEQCDSSVLLKIEK